MLARALLVLAVTTAPLAAQSTPFSSADSTRFLALGRRANRFLQQQMAESLVAMMPADTAKRMGGVAGLADKTKSLMALVGAVQSVVAEKLTRRGGLPQFWFEAKYPSNDTEPLVTRLLFNASGQLIGIGLGPKSQAIGMVDR